MWLTAPIEVLLGTLAALVMAPIDGGLIPRSAEPPVVASPPAKSELSSSKSQLTPQEQSILQAYRQWVADQNVESFRRAANDNDK